MSSLMSPLTRLSPALRNAVSVAVLAVLVAIAWLAFRWQGVDYFAWYLDVGPVIGLVAAVASLPQPMRANLIDANPFVYLGSYLQLIGTVLMGMGTPLRAEYREAPLSLIDLVFSALWAFVIVVAAFAWLLLVVPLQYFLFLVSGAPARAARGSRVTAVARHHGDGTVNVSERARDAGGDDDRWDIGFGSKPFAVTQAFNAVLLWGIGLSVT